MKKVQTIKRN